MRWFCRSPLWMPVYLCCSVCFLLLCLPAWLARPDGTRALAGLNATPSPEYVLWLSLQ